MDLGNDVNWSLSHGQAYMGLASVICILVRYDYLPQRTATYRNGLGLGIEVGL